MSGNIRKAHDCPYCWRVVYSKGALTNHINAEHWREREAEVHTHNWVVDRAGIRYRDEDKKEFTVEVHKCECGEGRLVKEPVNEPA